MNKIYLSIVIPAHNSQNTIQQLLFSINNSPSVNFDRLEVIVIDDGSTDDTLKILKQIGKVLNFKLIIIRLKTNLGPAKARNIGAKRARGKYLLLLDGDVELKKYTLFNVFKLINKNKVRAFTGIWDYHQKTTNFFPQFKALRDWSYWSGERKKYSHYYLFSTRIAGIEKKLFAKLGGFIEDYREPTVEDIEFTYRIEKQSPIRFCSNIIVNHEFEGFFPIAVKYFKRSRDWAGLYLKRFRFDPVATSKIEAVKSILSSLMIFLLLVSIFIKLLIIPAVFLVVVFIFLDAKFLKLIFKKKGLAFLIKAVPTSIMLYFVINLGAAWGYLLAFKNRKQITHW